MLEGVLTAFRVRTECRRGCYRVPVRAECAEGCYRRVGLGQYLWGEPLTERDER